jgi:hypothetical protein
MKLENAQYTTKVHAMGAIGLLSGFLTAFFAATVSLAPTAIAFAQNSAQAAQVTGQTQGAVEVDMVMATTSSV